MDGLLSLEGTGPFGWSLRANFGLECFFGGQPAQWDRKSRRTNAL